jgi:hypothetical protein
VKLSVRNCSAEASASGAAGRIGRFSRRMRVVYIAYIAAALGISATHDRVRPFFVFLIAAMVAGGMRRLLQ